MPSAKVLEQKKQVVAELIERLNASCAGVIVDYKGINVTDDTKLRKELREAGVEYTVVKNTLLRLAIASTELQGLDSVLEGTTAIATSADDYVAAARILCKFADTHNGFEIKNAVTLEQLEEAMKSMLGIVPDVHLVAPKTIQRSEGKAVRVIDERKLLD